MSECYEPIVIFVDNVFPRVEKLLPFAQLERIAPSNMICSPQSAL